MSLKSVVGEAVHLEYFQKWDVLCTSKRKGPLNAVTSHNCCLSLDSALFRLTSPYPLGPPNLSPSFTCNAELPFP